MIYFDDNNTFFFNPNKGIYAAILEFNNKNKNCGLVELSYLSGKYNQQIYILWKIKFFTIKSKLIWGNKIFNFTI